MIHNSTEYTVGTEERIKERIKELTKSEKDVYLVLIESPNSTQQMIADKLNFSEQYVRKIIKKLKDKKFIKRAGTNRKGFWEFYE